MYDFLFCETCETLVSTSLSKCPCCKRDFKKMPYTAALLTFCQFLDKIDNPAPIESQLEMIQSSIFKDHPLIRYRKARLKILQALGSPETMNTKLFFSLLSLSVAACAAGPHYWEDLVKLLTALLPSASLSITEEEWLDIVNLTRSNYKDNDQAFVSKLALQINT